MLDGVRLTPRSSAATTGACRSRGLYRVEVVRGPYSALYGADALGGVVQLVPARRRRPRVRVGGGGRTEWRRVQVEATVVAAGWEVVVAGGSRTGAVGWPTTTSRRGRGWSGDVPFDGGRLGVSCTARRASPRSSFSARCHRLTVSPRRRRTSPRCRSTRLGASGELEVMASRVERDQRYTTPTTPPASRPPRWSPTPTARCALHERWAPTVWRRRRMAGGPRDRRVELRREPRRPASDDAIVFAQDDWSAGGRSCCGRALGQRVVGPRAVTTREWPGRGGLRGLGLVRAGVPRAVASASCTIRFREPGAVPGRSPVEEGVPLPSRPACSVLQLVAFSNRQRDLIDFDFVSFRFVNVARALEDGVERFGPRRSGPGPRQRLGLLARRP